jgi:hypothetical protein
MLNERSDAKRGAPNFARVDGEVSIGFEIDFALPSQ